MGVVEQKPTGLAAASLSYVIGEVACRLAAFLFLPLTTRFLGPIEFGGLQLAFTLIRVAVFVGSLSVHNAIDRFVPEMRDPARVRRFVSAVLFLGTLSSAILAALLWFAEKPVGLALSLEGLRPGLFFWIALSIPVFQVKVMTATVLRAQRRSLAFNLVNLIEAGAGAGLGLLAVVLHGQGLVSFLIGQVVGAAISALLGLWLVRRSLTWRLGGAAELQAAARYSLPLLALDGGVLAMSFVDRFALAHWADLALVGVYTLAAKVALPVTILGMGINRAFLPLVFSQDNQQDPAVIQRGQRFSLGVLGALAAATVAMAPTIVAVVGGTAFAPAADLAVVLVPVAALQVLPRILGIGHLVERRSALLAGTALGAAVVNIVLVAVLVPRFRGFGAAVAAALAWALCAGAIVGLAPRYARPPRLLVNLMLIAAGCGGVWFVERLLTPITSLLGAAAALVHVALASAVAPLMLRLVVGPHGLSRAVEVLRETVAGALRTLGRPTDPNSGGSSAS